MARQLAGLAGKGGALEPNIRDGTASPLAGAHRTSRLRRGLILNLPHQRHRQSKHPYPGVLIQHEQRLPVLDALNLLEHG